MPKSSEDETAAASAASAAAAAAPAWSWYQDGMVPKYDGVDQIYTASKWVQDIEENAEIFQWSPIQTLLVARRSLVGVAAKWLKSEKTHRNFEELKTALVKEFPDAINCKEVHEMMSARKKKKEESCYEYMLTMKEMGRRGKIPDYVAIQYILEGITDYESNKVVLYGVTTYSALKEKLAIYETMKKNAVKKRPVTSASSASNTSSPEDGEDRGGAEKSERRCFKCGDKGHLASACPKGVKCFKCGAFGHVAPECPATDTNMTGRYQHDGSIGNRQPTSASKVGSSGQQAMCMKLAECSIGDVVSTEDELHVGYASDVNNRCKQSMKTVQINGYTVETLIDTGSELNLVTDELFLELNVANYNAQKVLLTGLGSTKVYAAGNFDGVINVDGNVVNTKFCVVPRSAMSFKMILGQPFLNNVTVVVDKGSINIMALGCETLQCLISESTSQPVCYVPDEHIRSEAEELAKNYKPQQVRDALVEMKIILKDDIPVAQRPRRLSVCEQQIVDEQVNDWLKRGKELLSLIKEEDVEQFSLEREELREKAKLQISKMQEENKKQYNKRRKPSTQYTVGDRVAIKRTQFGTHMKLKPKYLGPYKVVKILGRDRYEVEKADSAAEGPWRTSSAADFMKGWPEIT